MPKQKPKRIKNKLSRHPHKPRRRKNFGNDPTTEDQSRRDWYLLYDVRKKYCMERNINWKKYAANRFFVWLHASGFDGYICLANGEFSIDECETDWWLIESLEHEQDVEYKR